MENFQKVDWKDIAIRALKTFVQATIAVLIVSDDPFSQAALIPAVAAGASATWNWIKATI